MPAAPHAPPFAPIAPESAGMPLYRVVKASLLRSIESGQHPPGSALPSETELALAFGVSIGTLRKAVDELAAEHIVARRQGRGTFVATHTADRFLLVANGGVAPFDGDLDDYRRFLLSGENTATRREATRKPARAA